MKLGDTHDRQVCEPERVWYWPRGQGEHGINPVFEKVPGGHMSEIKKKEKIQQTYTVKKVPVLSREVKWTKYASDL